MLIGVIGAGALGLYYGAMLQKGGNRVKFLLRRDYLAIQEDGLTVHSIDGDFHLPTVEGFADPLEIGPVDLVLVGLKTFSNQRMIELISPLVLTTQEWGQLISGFQASPEYKSLKR